jgi:hypothetical protein
LPIAVTALALAGSAPTPVCPSRWHCFTFDSIQVVTVTINLRLVLVTVVAFVFKLRARCGDFCNITEIISDGHF